MYGPCLLVAQHESDWRDCPGLYEVFMLEKEDKDGGYTRH
jgi:hypothetical protein